MDNQLFKHFTENELNKDIAKEFKTIWNNTRINKDILLLLL